jgi:hypothetical protein
MTQSNLARFWEALSKKQEELPRSSGHWTVSPSKEAPIRSKKQPINPRGNLRSPA